MENTPSYLLEGTWYFYILHLLPLIRNTLLIQDFSHQVTTFLVYHLLF